MASNIRMIQSAANTNHEWDNAGSNSVYWGAFPVRDPSYQYCPSVSQQDPVAPDRFVNTIRFPGRQISCRTTQGNEGVKIALPAGGGRTFMHLHIRENIVHEPILYHFQFLQ